MIDLAFQANDEEIRRDLEAEPERADPAALEDTFFVVPTRFVIDGIELLAYPGVHAAWRPLPLLGFAPRLRRVAAAVGDGDTASISLMDGGVLQLERRGDALRVSSSLAPEHVAMVSRDELARESAKFAADVCAYLALMAPAMSEHPSWPTWCSDPE
jgi:hypothetical protein